MMPMTHSAVAAPSVSGLANVLTTTVAAGRLTATFTTLSTSSWSMNTIRRMRMHPTAATPASWSSVRRRRTETARAPTNEAMARIVESTTTLSKMRMACWAVLSLPSS